MKSMSYDAELHTDFNTAVEQVTAALKDEGFGIISRIDMHTTFKEKIDKDIPPHIILGACNPDLAYKAVTALPEASLMLPCNVTLQQEGESVVVRVMSPETMMAMAGFDEYPAVNQVGIEADARLRRVAASLGNQA
jgi:uncharacterized protein (DUF302 family)